MPADAVGVGGLDPAEHDVAGGLREPLALDDALAVLGERALAQERLEHRRLRLLELQEQRIVVVAAEHQDDPGARAHAADADDLAGRVDVAIALEQPPPVGAQRPPVRADEPVDERLDLRPRRRPVCTSSIGTISGGSLTILRLPSTTVVSFENARMLSFDRVLARLRSNTFRRFRLICCGDQRRDRLEVDAGVPDVEVRHPPEVPDRLPVGARHRPVDHLPLLRVEAAVAAGDGEAGDQPLDVPLERAGQRLVEVVDAEDQPPVGRAERTEVRQVRIAAELHVQARPRDARQIGRHRVRRAAIEGERRDEHAPVADRHELLDPRGGLLLEQVDGVEPLGRRRPLAMDGTRRRRTRRLPRVRALRGRRMRHGPVAAGRRRVLVVLRASPRGSGLNGRHGLAPSWVGAAAAAGRDDIELRRIPSGHRPVGMRSPRDRGRFIQIGR